MPRLTDRQQITRIKQIIRKDANTTDDLIDEKGKMCAIGGLAFYGAHVTQKALRRMGVGQAFAHVQRRFPVLAEVEPEQIYEINDNYEETPGRRRALCAFFDGVLDD